METRVVSSMDAVCILDEMDKETERILREEILKLRRAASRVKKATRELNEASKLLASEPLVTIEESA